MNIMDKTPAKITLHIDGMTWEQVREMIEERYGALMWDHKSTAYPTDSVVVRMAFAEPAGNVAQRAIGKAAPQQEAQEPAMWAMWRESTGWLAASAENTRDECIAKCSEAAVAEGMPTDFAAAQGWVTRPLYASPASQGDALSQAARDVLAERQRQITAEGWTPEHDDEHGSGEMALAAACYAAHSAVEAAISGPRSRSISVARCRAATKLVGEMWPWSSDWWKPADKRRNLVKAGALVLSELERMDRADATRAAQDGK